jgi:serine/threonine protein kinase
MNTMKICSGCQKPLEANAPDGLCPECLLKAGLGTGVDLGPDSQAESGRTSFVAPSVEEVARLFPQLEMLGFIGQGGMGAVYKARQKALDRVVALKILPPGIGQDPAFAERFTREAKALAKLNHTGIVTIHDFGRADGLFYFLMEFVDGVSLRHLLEVERVSAREALAIVPQICDALQYAHDQGIVHRDIKPENILLDRQGRVKVADFGLAKLVGTDAGGSPLTPTLSPGGGEGGSNLTDAGKVMGTPQYMAPEQREHPSEVDHRADIYSLGVVFYQMLTGELPGKPIEAPSHKVQIDVRLDEVVLRALEKEPQRRYQQVSQVKTAVEMISQSPGTASPASRTETSGPRLLKGDAGFVTTPEQLGTFEGQLFLWHRRAQLLLDDRQLTVSRAGVFTVIPLAAIRDLSIGHYGRVMHPMGLDFISVTYDADGQTQRRYFSPYESWFGLPSNFNRIVFEWFNAIRAAVVAATGREPGNTPAEQLGVPPGSKALYALLLLPLLMGGIFVIALVRRSTGDAATHSFHGGLWVILAVVGVGFLALIVGRLFGGGPKSRPAGSPRQTSWLPPIVMVGQRAGKAVIHWPGVLLTFVLILVLAEAGAIFASTVLTGGIQSWAVAIALLPAVVFMGMLVRLGRMTPVEKLTSLDGTAVPLPGSPARPRTVWRWAAAMVGLVLLIPVVVIVVAVLGRLHKAESVRQELQAAERARLTARLESARGRGSLLPEITQVLGAVEGNTTHWLDLDTGRQMPLSFPDDEAAKLALFRTNGLDLMGIVTKEEIGVACREMVVRQVEGSRWDRVTAEEIISETPSAQFGPGADAVHVITTSPGRKVTIFFRTREGGHGILQIIGQSENPLGVKIRYKLVKTPTSSQGQKSAQGRQIADSGEVSVCNRNG